MMSRIWAIFIIAAVAFGMLSGRIGEVSRAAVDGASASVELILSITGMMCLWSGLMNVMTKSGLASKISAILQPLLSRLFRDSSSDKEAMEAVSANVTANLLGLSNASTPIGLRAAARIFALSSGRRIDDLLLLIVINGSSLQLIPSTVAAVRASFGASSPYDILLPVWMASAFSVISAVTAALLLRRRKRRDDG